LRFSWFVYGEAGVADGAGRAALTLAGAGTDKVTITPSAACRPLWLQMPNAKCPAEGFAHGILSVTDNGSPRLTSYRGIVVHVRAAQ